MAFHYPSLNGCCHNERMYPSKKNAMKRKKIRLLPTGGLGDILLGTPSIKALKQKYPQSRIIVFYRNKNESEIFQHNPYVDDLRPATFWANPIEYSLWYFKKIELTLFHYPALSPSLNYNKNSTEIIAEMLGVELQDKNLQVYLTQKEDNKAVNELSRYKKPVIIHVTSNCSKNQNWPVENWERLIKEMEGYTFIQLGLSKEDKIEGAIDFRGKTTFREALALIKNAQSFVGVVSSFSHATNAFDIPGVVLFGASTPEVWGHRNNINIYKALRCAPCIDLLLGSMCPYGKPCMTQITVEEVKSALLQQLSKRNQKQ